MKRIINKFFRLLGYEIHRFSRFEKLVQDAFQSTPDFFFVQIGANDGVSFDSFLYPFVMQTHCAGLVVEPIKLYYDRLVQNYAGNPHVVPVNLGIHATQKTADFYVVNPELYDSMPAWVSGAASLSPEHYKLSPGVLSPADLIIQQAECVHLMTLIEDHNVQRIDLLQIDAEGYDGEIIRMLDFDCIKPKVIKFEYFHLGKNELAEIRRILKEQGYKLFREKMDWIAVLK